MAPAALWVALVFELQLWATGHTVPAQVGDSWDQGGQLRITKFPSQLLLTAQFRDSMRGHPVPSRHAPRASGDPLGTRNLARWEPGVVLGSRQPVPEIPGGSLRELGQGSNNTQPDCSSLRNPFCPAVSRREGHCSIA